MIQRRLLKDMMRSQVRLLSVFIQTEKTPNPSSMKFIPSKPVLSDDVQGTSGFHFSLSDKEYLRSPLAKKILSVEDVTSVFIGKDFITVSKAEKESWNVLKPMIFKYLMDWFDEGVPAVEDEAAPSDTTILDDDSEVVAMIKELIEVRIRPAVQEDGGDIFFRGFDEATGIVQVELAGSCVGCPSSSITLRNGVENMLQYYVPEVTGIENVTSEDDDDIFKLSFPNAADNNAQTTSSSDSAAASAEDDPWDPLPQPKPKSKDDDPRVSI
mmetsp:Transcript_20265/g.30922  ORF Transcript_20265/g.30922 Transcript_20265/m.30922 type:complete len:269 (-) Transcript_20265:722-1528(-)